VLVFVRVCVLICVWSAPLKHEVPSFALFHGQVSVQLLPSTAAT